MPFLRTTKTFFPKNSIFYVWYGFGRDLEMLSDQSKYIIVDPQKLLEPIKNKKLEQTSYLKKIIGDYFANTIIMLAYTYIEKGKFALVEKTKPHY